MSVVALVASKTSCSLSSLSVMNCWTHAINVCCWTPQIQVYDVSSLNPQQWMVFVHHVECCASWVSSGWSESSRKKSSFVVASARARKGFGIQAHVRGSLQTHPSLAWQRCIIAWWKRKSAWKLKMGASFKNESRQSMPNARCLLCSASEHNQSNGCLCSLPTCSNLIAKQSL